MPRAGLSYRGKASLRTTSQSASQTAPLVGEPLAKRRSFPPCQSLSPWERWHCEAMTERASPARKSRWAAIGRLFVRAILSLCLGFAVSGLALSVSLRSPAPPKGEPLACRSAFVWTLKARRGAKGRALLQRSGFPSYNLSVCFAASSPSRGASGEEEKFSALPRPPLGRGGGTPQA